MIDLNITLDENCSWIDQFVHNDWLWSALLFKLICLPMSFMTYMIFIMICGIRIGFHSNARILLLSAHFFTILYVCAAFVTSLDEIIRFYPSKVPTNLCSLTRPVYQWMPIMLPNYLGYYGMIYSNAVMLLERIIATWKYKSYEKMSPRIGIVLFLSHVFLSCLTTYINFVIPFINSTITNLRVVVISTYNLRVLEGTNFTLIAGKTIIIVSFHLLLAINRRRRVNFSKFIEKFSSRYQAQENIRSIELILPMVYTHYCCFLPSLVNLVLPILNGYNPRLSRFDAFVLNDKRFLGDVVVLYPAILPIVLLKTNHDLRARLWRFFHIKRVNKRNLKMVENNMHDMVEYFKNLAEFWDLPETGRQSKMLKRKVYPTCINVRNL